MVNKLRVCVVGGGRIGTIHMEAVQRSPRMVLRFFVDVDEKRRNEIVEQYENVKSFKTFAEIVENEETRNELDAVIVCSPTACHFETVMLCIEHKKPVMCEKPLSMKVDEIIVAYQKARECNVPLLTGYHRRHDASFCELERSIREGLIGDLRAIRSCSRDNPFPAMSFLKISGGIMHDCASHDIDVLRWLTREDPVEIFSFASSFHEDAKALNDWDHVMIILKFPSGTLSHIEISRIAPFGYDQRIEALGSGGMLQAENRRPTSVVRSTIDGISIDPNYYSFPQRYKETYATELEHFVDMILHGVPPKVTGEDCIKTAIIADTAHESCKLGVPIKIDYSAYKF